MVNWIGLARAMMRISSASAYTEFHQATNETFDFYMPIVVSGASVSGLVSDRTFWHSFSRQATRTYRRVLLRVSYCYHTADEPQS